MSVLPVAPPQELGSAFATADQSVASNVTADITGVTVTVTVTSRPIVVRYGTHGSYNTAAGGFAGIYLYEDGVLVGQAFATSATASAIVPVSGFARRTPSAGAHTYKLQMFSSVAGAGTVHTNASATSPVYLEIAEV